MKKIFLRTVYTALWTSIISSLLFIPAATFAEAQVVQNQKNSPEVASFLPIDLNQLTIGTQKAVADYVLRAVNTITFAQGKHAAFFDFRSHFEDVAFKLMNKAFWTVVGYNPDPSSAYTFGEKKESEKVRITLINGMLNAHSNAEENAKLVSELHGSAKVHYLYSASHGFTADLLRVLFAKSGFATPSARLLAGKWRALIKEMGGETNGGKIIHYAHSLGGAETYLALRLLTEDERKMISVRTFGSASLIDEGSCRDVINYVSTYDAIPAIDFMRYLQGRLGNRAEVQFLQSQNCIPMADHLLGGGTYKTRLTELGKKFQEEYDTNNLLSKDCCPQKKTVQKSVHAKKGQSSSNKMTSSDKRREIIQKVKGQIQAKNYPLLGKTLAEAVNESFTLVHLKKLAEKIGCKPLKRAIRAARNILQKDANLGLKIGELVQLALFIETDLTRFKEQKKYYLREHETQMPRIIEYDPISRQTFIHLGERNIPMLGAGFHKRVTKSILYDKKNPDIVANCRTTTADEKEMKYLQKMQGTPGIVEGLAFIKHTQQKEQEDKLEIILKLYNSKTLRHIYYNGTLKFSLSEKMNMALDLLKGIEKVHKLGLIHRDLHTGNYLVDVQPGMNGLTRSVIVAITDFGGACLKKECAGLQPQAFRWYLAPESFFFQEMEGDDYLCTDIYALGCVFYEIFYEKDPAWFDDKYYVNLYADEMTKRVDQQALVQLLQISTKERREALRIKQLTTLLTPEERFEVLILRMVHADAKERGKAKLLRAEMEQIVTQIAQ